MRAVLAILAALVFAGSASAQTLIYQERMGQPFNAQCMGAPCGVWNTPLPSTNTNLDPQSSALVGIMDYWFGPNDPQGRANFGIDGGFSWWIAPSHQATVTVNLANHFHPGLSNVLTQVPIPAGAHPSDDSDSRMAILQPSSRCSWEFWHVYDVSGVWTASTGGRTCNVFNAPGVFQNVSDQPNGAGNVLEENTWGSGAAGLTNMAGVPMVDELAHGTIPHAVVFAIQNTANCSKVWNAPADRTDGTTAPNSQTDPSNCIPEGAVFRLPPPCVSGPSTIGVCYNLSDLSAAPPLVQEVAAAVQTYGLIDDNSTSGGVIPVESASTDTNVYEALGGNPYTQAITGEANTPFLGSYGNQNALALFPWNYLEAVRMNVISTADPTWYLGVDPPAPYWPN